jgi:hypothetical protein
MPARNPQAVRQRTIDAAPPADGQAGGGSGGPGACGAQPRRYPIRARSDGELAERVRRAEDYAVLGAEVVELNSESRAGKRSTRAWAITRRAERVERLADHRRGRPGGGDAARISRTDRTSRSHRLRRGEFPPMLADPISWSPGWRDPAGSVRGRLVFVA